jgi:hypothetical protein
MRELDELESNNTKRIVLALVGLVAIAAGIGFLFRSKGIGAPEEDQRILIIEDRTVGFEHFCADLGFEAIAGDFEAWQEELAEQDGSRSASEFGLPDMLEFADEHGYGYVVIEHPQRFADEIAQLEFDDEEGATSIGDSEFAVLSVGNFAGPHQLGVDPPASTVELDVGRRMLRTLFAHPRLSQTLDAGAAPSEIQAARLKLDKAIELIEQITTHEERAAAVLRDLETELASFGGARLLHDPLAGTTAYSLRDGRVMMRSDHLQFTVDESGLGLESAPVFWLEAIPADVPASASARVGCPELLGGGGPRHSIMRMELSVERDAMFVLERGGTGKMFAFDPAAGPCGLREVGTLSMPEPDNTYMAVTPRAIALRHVDEANLLHIDVHSLDAAPISIALDTPGFDSSSSLVWIDERRLVNLVDLVDGRPALVFIDLDHLDTPSVSAIQPPQQPDQFWTHELARIPGSDSAFVLRWSVNDTYHLSRLDFDPTQAVVWTEVVEVGGHMRGFEIDPRGKTVAFTYEGGSGVDVVLAPLPEKGGAAGELRVILDDAHEHRDVGFRPQHDELLFRTRIRLERPEATLLTTHAIDLAKK